MSARYRCPNCQRSDGLWEGLSISGWRSIDENLQPTGKRDVDWAFFEPDGNAGCSECGWDGLRSSLEHVGIDGNPLPHIHPDQRTLAEPAR